MSLSKEIAIYTTEDLEENKGEGDNSFFLKITLNAQEFLLPVINVGGEEKPEYIAILDPNDQKIQEAGSEIIAQFLKELETDLVITAPSLKSEKMINEATAKADLEEKPLFILGGSELRDSEKYLFTKEEVEAIAQKNTEDEEEFWIEECRPITLAADPTASKFFALTKSMMETIFDVVMEGGSIAIVDDVYSSGATIKAIQELLKKASEEMGIELPQIPIVVLAREALETNDIFDPEALQKSNEALNLYCSVLIPVLLKIPETN